MSGSFKESTEANVMKGSEPVETGRAKVRAGSQEDLKDIVRTLVWNPSEELL